jgi:ribosome-binding protein aMBF1 (putative translation factor)
MTTTPLTFDPSNDHLNPAELNPDDGQKFVEGVNAEMDYLVVSRYIKSALSVIDIEQRRAKKRKLKGSPQAVHQANRDADEEIERYQRKIADYEEEMRSIRAKYAGRMCVNLHVNLVDLGAGLITAREAAGLSQVDLADRLKLPLAYVERWEQCCYADLSLAELYSLLKALGLNPNTNLRLANDVPNWDASHLHKLPM